jgi:hypothetical protein
MQRICKNLVWGRVLEARDKRVIPGVLDFYNTYLVTFFKDKVLPFHLITFAYMHGFAHIGCQRPEAVDLGEPKM